MKKEKQVRTYKRRTKSGKVVTVKAHTAKYEAADKAKELAKKKGAGEELEERKKKKPVQLEIPFDEEGEKEVLNEIKDTEKKTSKKVRPVGSGTNGPEPKKKKEPASKKEESKSSEPAFTAAEFKEWYRGTGSAADKKVAKALRAQLGRAGYRKLEDEAIDNYSSRGHLSMFKRVSGGNDGTKTGQATNNNLVEHYDQFNKKYTGKKVGSSFNFSEGRGKDKITYNAQFVTDGRGRYGFVVKDSEDPNSKYYVGITDVGIPLHSAVKKAAKENGLKYDSKSGTFIKAMDKRAKKTSTEKPKVSQLKIDSKVVRGYAKDEDISIKDARKELSSMTSTERNKHIKYYSQKDTEAKNRTSKMSEGPKGIDAAMKKLPGGGKAIMGKDATAAKKTLMNNGYELIRVNGKTYLMKGNSTYMYTSAGLHLGGARLEKSSKPPKADMPKNAKTINEGKVPKTFSALKKAGWTYVQTNKGKVGGGVRGYWVSPDRETMVFGGADFRPGKGRSEHVDVDKPKKVTKTILSALDRRK